MGGWEGEGWGDGGGGGGDGWGARLFIRPNFPSRAWKIMQFFLGLSDIFYYYVQKKFSFESSGPRDFSTPVSLNQIW